MPAVYVYRHRVQPEEIDRLGHVNNVVYLKWMEAAAVAHSKAQGWPGDRYLELGKGWVAKSHWIEYHHPAREGWNIVVRTWVASMRKSSSVRRYRIEREDDGTLLASAETRWAFIDYATGKPVRIAPEVIASYEIVGDEPNR
ncbi:acyl-CoA thioesterase [Thermostilla marina]